MQVKYYNSGNSQWESANPLPPEEIYIGDTPPAQGINAKLWLDTSVTGLLPASYAVADNCEQTVAGQAALDAHQGYLLQNQINNLDESINQPTNWLNLLSLNTNVVNGFLTGNNNVCIKLGRLVIINISFALKALSATTQYACATIPEEYRPPANTIIWVTSNSNYSVYTGYIQAYSGQILFRSSAATTNNGELSVFSIYYL